MIKHQIKPVKIEAGSGITQINKLTDVNWANWREDIIQMLNFLKVKEYLLSNIPRPDPDLDPDEAEAWDHNDSYALHLISLNLSEGILANDPEFSVTDTMFKSIITNSLLPSWHAFTKPYVRRCNRVGCPPSHVTYLDRFPCIVYSHHLGRPTS